MKFKNGDRVHVTRFNGENVDFYGTLKIVNENTYSYTLVDCTDKDYEYKVIYKEIYIYILVKTIKTITP